MTATAREAAVLETVLPRLKEDGYEIFRSPSASLLPRFMRAYSPDAIAIKPNDKLAIEVIADDRKSTARLDRLRSLFAEQDEWRLVLYWASEIENEEVVAPVAGIQIDRSLNEVRRLRDAGFTTSALLQGWATFEAAARALAPGSFERPQSSVRLIEELASAGHITPDEADRLRKAGHIRNRIAHGDLTTDIPGHTLDDVIEGIDAMTSGHEPR